MTSFWPLLVLVALLAADATRQKGFYDENQTEEEENKGLHFVALRRNSVRVRRSPVEETVTTADNSATKENDAADADVKADKGSGRGFQTQDELLNEVDITDKKFNETRIPKTGINETRMDDVKYYENVPASYSDMWVDLDSLNASSGIVKEHPMLSKSYRRAATIKLSFRFPFYGHEVENITIATGGFLYTGTYVHSWLAATQYIAPLMANFDTSQDDAAKIRYADNKTALIVEWTNVHLQGKDHVTNSSSPATSSDLAGAGPFTFQAILRNDGDIVFSYSAVPEVINKIHDDEHPVKVGLSDAYIMEKTIFFVRRKTIYEYHRVSLKETDIMDKSAIYFRALATCNRKDTCDLCLGDESIKDLGCKWCPRLGQCSDGVDRRRQHWLKNGCDHSNLQHVDKCGSPLLGRDDGHKRNNDDDEYNYDHQAMDDEDRFGSDHDHGHDEGGEHKKLKDDGSSVGPSASHAGVAFLAIMALLVASTIAWFGYAYFFPHSWSGRLLIKYRPSRWHWFRSEPRYSAASIHM